MNTPGAIVGAVLLLAGLAGCAEQPAPAPAPTVTPDATQSPAAPPEPGTTPPDWLFTRPLPIDPATGLGEVRPTPPELQNRRFTHESDVPPLPGTGFESRVERAPADVIARSTWEPSCPVGAGDLDWVRVTFRGFDGDRHTGELLVHRRVSADVVGVFRALWEADFPIEQMRITESRELELPPTGDGNNTAAFVCRSVTGGGGYSEHAYGLAIDVNPFQNPYRRGDVVIPELASAYLDRDDERPGMILPGDDVVTAFARIGWGWGGTWRSLTDPMHFSHNGR